MTSKQDAELQQDSPVQWFFGVVAICAVLVLVAVGAWRLWPALDESALWFLPVCGLTGYLAADFMSGMAHWLADRYGTVDTPLVGAHFIGPFREHHVDPKGITRHGFVEVNGNNCICSLPFLVAGHLLWPSAAAPPMAIVLFGSLLCFILSIFMTNQFHRWAHMDSPPTLVVWLQRGGLILGRAHHQTHHIHPFESHYCITSGWLNGPLGAIGFWRMLERLVLLFLGVRVEADGNSGGGDFTASGTSLGPGN
jgi:ubiquitin-conjugating enzyme E2 variant